MNKEVALLFKEYIDRRIEEEFAGRKVGSDGYMDAPILERKAREQAWTDLLALCEDPSE